MMDFINRFFSLESLKDTALRFPLSVFCALAMFVIALIDIHEIINIDDEILGRGAATMSSLYLWFGVSTLISENRQTSSIWGRVLPYFVAAGLVALFALSPLYWVHYFLVLPALLLGIVIAPYLSRKDDWSLWQFNRNLWLGVALSFLAALLFAGGVSLAFVAIDHLFGVDVDEKLYADIWLFASVILGPVYALSRVPKRFDYSEETREPPAGLRFIANWISVPIVFVYLLILYAYFIKILVTGEVPNGWLAWLITGFVGSGVITYLIAWPLRGREGGLPQLQLFYKIFFPALFVPIGFHFFAIWERISAYGITEQRYVLIVSALWFLIIAIAKSLPSVPLKVIPASLCVLLALSSFGPWGAVSVSGQSQFGRLESLLNKYELLKNGHVVKFEEGHKIIFDDRLSISSVLDYMCSTDRDDMIEPWFNVEGKDDWSCYANDLTKQLGFEYVYYRSSGPFSKARFNVSASHREGMDVSGYDILVKNIYANIYTANDKEPMEKEININDQNKMVLFFDGTVLRASINGYESAEVDVVSYISDKVEPNITLEELLFSGENADLFYRFYFYNIYGDIEKGKPEPDGIRFDFLFRVKNPKVK